MDISLSTSSISFISPFRVVSTKVYELLPFTRKGSIVLVKGQPAIDTGFGEAALTAVRFRETIPPSNVESGRYYLLASQGDPWAQRTLIAHGLAGLKGSVGIIYSDGLWPILKSLPATATRGWRFSRRSQLRPQIFRNGPDEVQRSARRGAVYMHQLYVATDPQVTGRVTIPALWDSHTGRVVCNESTDIVRILHQRLGQLGEGALDLYPADLAAEVDRLRAVVYGFNAGVYKCGLASSTEAYRRGLAETFHALEACEALLAGREFLAGDRLTEVDLCAFPTLIRFDVAYYTAFRCNRRRIRDFPNLSRYLERLYRVPAFRETVCFRTYLCVAFIEARWRGRTLGNLLRAADAAAQVLLGAAAPGASLWRRALAAAVSLPARVLSAFFP